MNWGVAARLGTISGALALSACMMPVNGGYQPAPPAEYSDVESPDLYASIDRADSMWEAIGNAPPDYAFSFEGAEPWAWQLEDGQRIVVEETADGIQSYYFAPDAQGPFLAVRPGMSFGFDGEAVAVVYGPDGGAMPRDAGAAHLGEGADLYARGRALLRAMLQSQRREVDSQAWIDTGPIIWGSVAMWDYGWQRYPGWGRHRDTVRNDDWRRRLALERLRREAMAERFRRWREGGFQGPPPGHFHRPGDGHGPGAGRPGRPGMPGRPGTDRPHQPGQNGRPPGAQPGRPPRPDAGQPGTWPGRPPRDAGQPGGRPWRGWRPNRPNPPAAGTPDSPAVVPVPGGARPGRPGWGGRPRPERDAERGGLGRPQSPPMAERPAAAERPRPDGPRRWGRPVGEGGAGRARPEGVWTRPERNAPAAARPQASAPAPAPAAPRAAPPPRAATPAPAPRSSGTVRERHVPERDKR